MADDTQFGNSNTGPDDSGVSSTRVIPNSGSIPEHVAVIMDGNGRWARNQGKQRFAGHRQGVETVRRMVKACGSRGVKWLTLFAFSSENWRRPQTEVRLLMELLTSALENEVRKLHKNNVQLKVVGDLSVFPGRMQRMIASAEATTADNDALHLQVAVNYGGRWDITQATRAVAQKVAAGELAPGDIDDATIEAHLATSAAPEPDLFIRTGGETRISNFLLWQLAYTELYFTDTLWPDFDEAEFDQAIASFATRQRRFGQTGDQVQGGKESNESSVAKKASDA